MPDGICPFVDWIPVQPFSSGGQGKVGFCDHTAGGFYGTLSNPGFWNNAGYSVHFCVARDGRACQLVSIFDRAWGQGRDANGNPVGPTSPGVTWPPFSAMNKVNPNEYLISTEHEDAVTINGQTVFIPGSQWTEAQYAMDLRIKTWCAEEIKRVHGVDVLKFGIDSLAGHYMFDPVSRANCPGDYWKNEYRARLYQDVSGSDEMFVRLSYGFADVSLTPDQTGYIDFSTLLGFPASCRALLEVYPFGGHITWFDGTATVENRRAGRTAQTSEGVPATVEVILVNGKCYMHAENGNTGARVIPLGYYQ